MSTAVLQNNGKLIIRKISSTADETKIIEYLKTLFKTASDEQLIQIIHKTPCILSRNIPMTTAEKIVGNLKKLDVDAEFIPNSKETKRQPDVKPKKTPSPKEPETSVTKKDIHIEILSLFQNNITHFNTSIFYKVSLLCVAVAMILLPLIYVVLIFGVFYLVFWHMTANISVFSNGGNIRGALIVYLAPLFIGGISIFFLVKPFFARQYSIFRPYRIEPLKEPLLFEVVKRIAKASRAPVPVDIYVDTTVNASASFKNGFSDFFKTNLTLTIGLPLANGMNIAQFAGIIAHELGHFSQSFGMRLSYLIRTINVWFARVVYERDVWDERIKQWSRTQNYGIVMLLWISQGFIWMTRKVLWVLMKLGHLISCYMSRQMEFDADRYEISLSGSNLFESTTKRIILLSQAYRWALDDLRNIYEEGKLADNFPGLVVDRANQTSAEIRKKIETVFIENMKTGFWDSHPSDNERIFAARMMNLPTILKTDRLIKTSIKTTELLSLSNLKENYDCMPPASFLFNDFNQLACEASYEYYCGLFGENIITKRFETVDHITKKHDAEIDCNNAINTFLKGQFSAIRPIGLASNLMTPPQSADAALHQIVRLKQELNKTAPRYNDILKRYITMHRRLLKLSRAEAIIESGNSINANDFNLTGADVSTIEKVREQTKQTFEMISTELENIEKNTSAVVGESIKLLFDPMMEKLIKNIASVREAVKHFIHAAEYIESKYSTFSMLEVCATQLDALGFSYTNKEVQDSRLLNILNQRKGNILGVFQNIRPELERLPYPFVHQVQNLSMGDYLIAGELFDESDPYDVMTIALNTLNSIYQLYARIAARLIYIAETVVNVATDSENSTPVEIPIEIIVTSVDDENNAKSQEDIDQRKKKYKSFLKNSLEKTRHALSPVPRSYPITDKLYNRLQPPSWITNDNPLKNIYQDQSLLLREGKIVWGQIVQANEYLFEDRSEDYPAAILFSMDPAIDEDPEKLRDIAQIIYGLKGKESSNEELNKVVKVITDEQTIWMNYYISAEATGSISVFYSSIMVHRKHLPLNHLNSGWFPILVHPRKTKGVMILPSKYWDSKMVDIWCSQN